MKSTIFLSLYVSRAGELAQLQLSSSLVVFQRCFHSHSVRPTNFRSSDCYFLFSILPLSLRIVSSGTLIERVRQFLTYLHTSPSRSREIAQFLPLDAVKYFLSLRDIIFDRSADRCENIFRRTVPYRTWTIFVVEFWKLFDVSAYRQTMSYLDSCQRLTIIKILLLSFLKTPQFFFKV